MSYSTSVANQAKTAFLYGPTVTCFRIHCSWMLHHFRTKLFFTFHAEAAQQLAASSTSSISLNDIIQQRSSLHHMTSFSMDILKYDKDRGSYHLVNKSRNLSRLESSFNQADWPPGEYKVVLGGDTERGHVRSLAEISLSLPVKKTGGCLRSGLKWEKRTAMVTLI